MSDVARYSSPSVFSYPSNYTIITPLHFLKNSAYWYSCTVLCRSRDECLWHSSAAPKFMKLVLIKISQIWKRGEGLSTPMCQLPFLSPQPQSNHHCMQLTFHDLRDGATRYWWTDSANWLQFLYPLLGSPSRGQFRLPRESTSNIYQRSAAVTPLSTTALSSDYTQMPRFHGRISLSADGSSPPWFCHLWYYGRREIFSPDWYYWLARTFIPCRLLRVLFTSKTGGGDSKDTRLSRTPFRAHFKTRWGTYLQRAWKPSTQQGL
jgi:hypothetical protein